MRKLFLTISVITLLFTSHINAQEIRLYVEKTEDLASTKFGFSYKGKHSERVIGSYFETNISHKKFKAIDLRINGKQQINKEFLEIDAKELLRNKGVVCISYRNPKFPVVIHYDTLIYPYPKDIDLMVGELNALESKAISLNVTFSNDEIKSYHGSELYAFLDTYGFSMDADHAMFEIEYSPYNSRNFSLVDSIPSSKRLFSSINEVNIKTDLAEKSLVSNHVNVTIKGEEYSSTHLLGVKYGGSLSIDFSGKDARYEGVYGGNGSHGGNVDVVVRMFNDSLYEVSFVNNAVFQGDKYLINPAHAKIIVTSYGGRGGNGSQGNDGLDGAPCDQPAEADWKRLQGQSGTDGYRGGNGGKGGNVTIHYERGFKPYLNIFKVINDGGASGKGGKGGKGGRHQKLHKNAERPYYSLGWDRARAGKSGKNGSWGQTGKVNYVQMN